MGRYRNGRRLLRKAKKNRRKAAAGGAGHQLKRYPYKSSCQPARRKASAKELNIWMRRRRPAMKYNENIESGVFESQMKWRSSVAIEA